jgi:hypothetical protein
MPNAILDPTGATQATKATQAIKATQVTAKRPKDLHGATIGLLINTKQNAAPMLNELGALLTRHYGVRAVVTRTKVNFAQPEPADTIKEMATTCDAIVTGVGDCGSCSASAVADGIAFEAAGLPAAVICSDAFKVTADAMAELRGAPGYRYATTPHPVAVLTPDQVRERAAQVLDDVAALLTE